MAPGNRLEDSDLQIFQDSLADLYADVGRASLGERMLKFLERIVPSDLIFFDHFGADGKYRGTTWTNSTVMPTADDLAICERYAHENPVYVQAVRKRCTNPVILSDFISDQAYRATNIYKLYYSRLEVNFQMAVSLPVTSDLVLTCLIVRAGEDFAERDRMMLAIAIPHMINTFRNASDFENLSAALERSNSGVASVDSHGKIKFASDLARKTLQKLQSGEIDQLPEEILQKLVEDGTKANAFNFKTRSGEVSVTLLSEDQPLEKRLLFQKRKFVTPESLAVLNLTPRETDVLYWIAQGKADLDIADLCEISTHTVSKHAQNIYKKLGVETRTAAMLRALEVL